MHAQRCVRTSRIQRISIGGARGLLNPFMNKMRRVSPASLDSQFPVNPRYAGPAPGSSRR